MQGKFPRTSLIISSLIVLSLSTSGVYARNTEKAQVSIEKNTGGKSLSSIFKRKSQVSLPNKVPVPLSRPKKKRKVNNVKKVPPKNVSEIKLPLPAAAPMPEKPDYSSIQKNVQDIVDKLNINGHVEASKQVRDDSLTERRSVLALGFAASDWEDGSDGFRFHAAAARRIMTEGRPDLALSEISFAKESALRVEDMSEADGLLAVADILMGKEVQTPVANGSEYPNDWKAMEVARASISGEQPVYSVNVALDEVSKWPDALSALIINHYAPLVNRQSANALLKIAERLNAAGTLNQSVLPLVRGYKYKVDGDIKKATSEFEAASSSVLGGVSGRAKLELLEAKLQEKSLSKEQIAATATDIANIKSADYIERRALRILADNLDGVEKINVLRRLEKLEFKPDAKASISNEIDVLIADVEATKSVVKDGDRKIPVDDNKIENKGEDESQKEATWLLDDERQEHKETQLKRVSIKSIKQSLGEVDDIVRSFEDVK